MTANPTDPTRRAALRLLAAAGVLPLTAGTASLLAATGCGSDRRRHEQAFARLLPDSGGMVVVGRAWLASQPGEVTVASLVDALGGPDTGDEPTLRAWLAKRQRRDWLEGNVVGLATFRITATEARLYALAALLSEPAR